MINLTDTVIVHGASESCNKDVERKDVRAGVTLDGRLGLYFDIPMPKGEKSIEVWLGTLDIRTVLLKLATDCPAFADLFADCASIATLCHLATLNEVQNPLVLEKLKAATNFVKCKYNVATQGAGGKDGAISALKSAIKTLETI